MSSPTIKEIARRLNVSISTVSRALQDNPRIGLRTKMRVQQLARELNYEPNRQAILFKQKKTYIIGVVLPFIREEFFSQAISGIEAAAMEHSYTILFGQSYDDPVREKDVVEVMKKQRVDGLIISIAKEGGKYEHLQALELSGVPVVYFDRVPPFEHINKVYCNLHRGTVEMVVWLIQRGVKRIALINGPGKLLASKERLSGYIEGLSKKKIKVDMQLVENTDLSKESTIRVMKRLLALKHQPNAIISFNDYVHMDVVQYAQQQNIPVNRDILFVSYANLPITGYTAYPPVASLEQYPNQQGKRAMEIMISMLDDRTKGNVHGCYDEEIIPTLVTFK
jgi:DNA-binding LacI/PurR family transcriptional regulator